MHPAFSVIVFTTASGAGYGLLFAMAVAGLFGLVPPEPWLGGTSLGLALALITGGLLSSSLHLGHPERAWMAFSQWRSSWLSREGVAAVLTYLPALVLALGWIAYQRVWAVAAFLAALGAVATVYSTAMIYASLKPVARWHDRMVPVCYLAFALATGLLLAAAVTTLLGAGSAVLIMLSAVAVMAAWLAKLVYWRRTDPRPLASTPEAATGLGELGKVRLLEPPHTETNYLLDEMGHRIARKHALKLRQLALLFGATLPLVLVLVGALLPPAAGGPVLLAAALSALLGILIERWLFFAEAQHTVTLYYGDWRP